MSIEFEYLENRKDIQQIKLYCLYVNTDYTLENITTTEVTLNTLNLLSKQELQYLIQINNIFDDTKYKLISILKHNVNTDSETIISEDDHNFLEKQTTIDNIQFKASNKIFEDLNSLYFLYFEDATKQKKLINTRRLPVNTYAKTKKQLVK